jgi:monofunctional biosynthetic peptidoglycan transglycosylase
MVVLSIGMVVLFKWVNPKVTPLMILRTAQKYSCNRTNLFKRQWTKLDAISPDMVHAVIVAEDSKFYKHFGFDFEAMREAYERNLTEQRIRGGSTISQQTAKNVFLLPHRSYVRKAFEAYFTVLIELLWGKRRIMEVYLNVIETGKCMYGIEEAAQALQKTCRKAKSC